MTDMTKERDKRIFTGILGILLVIICIAGYMTENRIRNVMGNEIDIAVSLENESLYIEERENDVIYIGGEGKLENTDLKVLLEANGLAASDVVNLVIGNEITEIGYNCINGYKYLETLRLGDNVGCVRNGAVLNCPALKYIYIPGSIEKLGRDFLYGCETFYIVTDGMAEELEEKLDSEPLFIFEKSGSYDDFISYVEEGLVTYQSFSTASLATTDPDAGIDPIRLHSGYVQFGPYTTMEKGYYTVVVHGQNFDEITNDNIYINAENSDAQIIREEADIESDKITYAISFSELAISVEFGICNVSTDGEIIEISGLDIYSNDLEVPAALGCWWD